MTTRPIGFPSPTADPGQQRGVLRALREAVEGASRQRGDPRRSFVRQDEIISAGLADQTGTILPVSTALRHVRRFAMFRGT